MSPDNSINVPSPAGTTAPENENANTVDGLELTVNPFAVASPPVALSAYFLKGVVPEWDLKDIYYGMMQFMVLQVFGLILIIIFPKIALWLPTLLYGQ